MKYQIGRDVIEIAGSDTTNSIEKCPLAFFVPGPARAKQSFRYGARGHNYTPARVKAWQADVGWAAQQAIHKLDSNSFPLTGDVAVDLIFLLKDKRRIDCDNLSKAVLDSLNGITWDDDKQTIDLHPRKFIVPSEESGVYVIIKETTPDLNLLAEICRRIQLLKKENQA